jgi:hypothetical protein
MQRDFGPHVYWDEFDEQMNVFRFKIGSLPQLITIRIWQNEFGEWDFSRSHAIKTPEQDFCYWELRSCDTREDALWHAVTGISHYFRYAIEVGCKPRTDWLQSAFMVIEGKKATD